MTGGRIFFGGAGAILAAAAPILAGYTSGNPRVLGRYSAPYAALLSLEIGLAAACIALAVLPEGLSRKVRGAIARATRSCLRSPWALGLAIAFLWTAAVLGAWRFAHVELGGSMPLHALAAAAVTWISFGMVAAARTDPRARARAAAKYAVILFTAAASLVLCEAFLRKNPRLLPAHVLYRFPARGESLFGAYAFEDEITVGYTYHPGISMHGRMKASEANLFLQQPNLLHPISPGEDRVLLEASFTTDENGYRNASPLLERYPIAVAGDSFTSLTIEPRLWPSILSERLSVPVLNLGIPGYGPQQERMALVRFGLPRKPEWVILAYFEGNDLINAENYEVKRRSGLGWCEFDSAQAGVLARLVTFHLVRHALGSILSGSPGAAPAAEEYVYPFTARIAGRDVPLSFSTMYLSRLDLSREDVESLDAFRAVVETARLLASEAEEAGAKLLVAYLPAKERCYAPFLPVSLLAEKLGGARRLMAEGGKLRRRGAGRDLVSAEGLLERIDGQRDALVSRLRAEGIEVLDLTPPFREAASRGQALYLTNDTHWSAAGHDLTASVIAERLRRGR